MLDKCSTTWIIPWPLCFIHNIYNCFFFFSGTEVLNSGLHSCKACALSLEPRLQSIVCVCVCVCVCVRARGCAGVGLVILEMGVLWTISLGCPWTLILPISVSQVISSIGVSHQLPLFFSYSLGICWATPQILLRKEEKTKVEGRRVGKYWGGSWNPPVTNPVSLC
jgi:hypothetical protein